MINLNICAIFPDKNSMNWCVDDKIKKIIYLLKTRGEQWAWPRMNCGNLDTSQRPQYLSWDDSPTFELSSKLNTEQFWDNVFFYFYIDFWGIWNECNLTLASKAAKKII